MKKKNSLWLLLAIAGTATFTACDKDGINGYVPAQPIGGYTSSREIASNRLVSYWSFENSVTDSVSNLSGTNMGTTFVAGKKGQALQVGGSNYYVFNSIGSVLPALKTYTASFWVNAPRNTSYGYGIFSINNPSDFWGNFDIYMDNGSTADTAIFKVHMNNAGVGQFPGTKIGNIWGKWTHIAVTYDSLSTGSAANFNVYANGINVYSTRLTKTVGSNTVNYGPLNFVGPTKMVIGTWQFQTNPSLTNNASAQTWAGSLNGALDEFKIWSTPLSAADVSALYKLESRGR